MKVLKFGGKSLADGHPLTLALSLITEYVRRGGTHFPAVVVSARGTTTDRLLQLIRLARRGEDYRDAAEELIGLQTAGTAVDLSAEHDTLLQLLRGVELLGICPPNVIDRILAFGEICSSKVVASLLRDRGVQALAVDAGDLFVTDDRYGDATVYMSESEHRTRAYFDALPEGTVAVVTGFIARDTGGHRTTLGRNGSNYSAALLANFLDANGMENYTNVDGIYSAHPGLVLGARKINELSYVEAAELAQFGADVLHYKTIDPLQSKEIPLRILNSFHPLGVDQQGTVISAYPSDTGGRAIAALRNKALLHFEGREMLGQPGIDARIFAAFRDAGVSVGMISQGSTERGTAIVVDEIDADRAVSALKEEFATEMRHGLTTAIYAERELAVIAIVGVSLAHFDKPYVALVRNGIVPQLVNNSPHGGSLFLVLSEHQVPMALNVIHGEIFEHPRRIHVACIGHGTVGGAFVHQLTSQRDSILRHKELDIRLFAIASSHQLLLDQSGIGTDWQERKSQAPQTSDPVSDIITYAREQALENVVVIDNTASPDIAARYIEIAECGFDLVSSNKIFNTSSYVDYLHLRHILKQRRRCYRYETNVGAGLPLIDNLRLLHLSGDRITRIRGLFSGSLGYLFSCIGGGATFVDALRGAMNRGLTEPDPRIDLSGMDVARKLLILARELDVPSELSDISVQNLVPPHLSELEVDDFMTHLSEVEAYSYRDVTTPPGTVLRYIGEFFQPEDSAPATMRCALTAIPIDSALGQVQGADSCFEIFTESYGDQPIVIQGAGAGAEVTARGVFGDLLRVADLAQ